MQPNKSALYRNLLILTSIGIFSFVLNIPKAIAGGGDDQVLTDANSNIMEITHQSRSIGFIPTFFDWSKWQGFNQKDQIVCREKDGNVVCADSLQAKNLRWIN